MVDRREEDMVYYVSSRRGKAPDKGGTNMEKRILVLRTKEGDYIEKEFESAQKRRKYVNRHHDSVVSYREFAETEGGERVFIREGVLRPRTKKEKAKMRAKWRRKKEERERREAAKPRNIRW